MSAAGKEEEMKGSLQLLKIHLDLTQWSGHQFLLWVLGISFCVTSQQAVSAAPARDNYWDFWQSTGKPVHHNVGHHLFSWITSVLLSIRAF
jgi:hypothetical protein